MIDLHEARQAVPMIDPSEVNPRNILKWVFGYDRFRPSQEEIIERVLAGRHALVIMPTGGGKSLCYQLPSLIRPGVGVIVSPLISLMKDQVDALLQLGVKAAFLNSSLPRAKQRVVEAQVRQGRLDLLYVAPERLMTPAFLELLDQTPVALLAIDEAHCISQWGHDFRPEYLQLTEIRRRYPEVPCIAVTATADAPTQREILRQLRLPREGLFVTGFDRPNIRYTVTLKRKEKQQLLQFIEREHAGEAGIVYCFTRQKVEKTAAWLREEGHEAVPYHAGLGAKQRQANQERFLNEEGLIVVATIAFGMGIDKPNVRFVAHLDVPRSLESYYQETGRAGRDGLDADAWMTYSLGDVVAMRKILESSNAGRQQQWIEQHKLNAMFGYCETVGCRRQVLLSYFGESLEAPCGNCDNCLHPVEQWDGTVAAQKVLSCIYRTGQRFGAGHVIDVLLGKDTDKVRRFRHERLSTFGIGAELTATEWRAVVRQLVAADYLRVDVDGYGSIRMTKACGPVLKGEEQVFFRKDPPPVKKEKKTRAAAEIALPETPDDRALFDTLRTLRLELARAQDVPPYVVFHDGTLAAMVQHRPRTLDAFGQLSGVGTVKLERYGEVFLDAIRLHEAQNG